MRSLVFSFFIIFLTFTLLGAGNWSTQKTEGAKNICYKAPSTMYCVTSSKKIKDKDLKQFLSVFMQFGDESVNKNDMLLHPGIKRLIKSSRKTEGKRILKGVNDFLKREAKRKKITISTGKDFASQKTMSEAAQKEAIDAVQWHKSVEVTAQQTGCSPDEVISVDMSITNSMNKDLIVKRDQIELMVMSTGNELMTVGSIDTDKIVVKPGKTQKYVVKIQMTGAMDPAMGYQLVPIIKKVDVLKEKPFVRCEK